MITEKVEWVAQAINDAMIKHGDYDPVVLAKAAIAAMREPTKEMILEADDLCQSPIDVWENMIDAALEEKK